MTGNCGCRICGLRGHSKNVNTRNVFPIFPKDDYVLEGFESGISAVYSEEKKQYMYGCNKRKYNAEEHTLLEETMSLADLLIDYLKKHNGDIENIRILLCVHDWVQDPGTATV